MPTAMSNARTAMTRGCEMAHPLHHAESSARKFGGVPSDYQSIHDWFDASNEHLALFTHRAMRHHAQGLFEAERVFGLSLTNSAGREIPCAGSASSISVKTARAAFRAWRTGCDGSSPSHGWPMAISPGILAMSPAATQGLPGHPRSLPEERFLA